MNPRFRDIAGAILLTLALVAGVVLLVLASA